MVSSLVAGTSGENFSMASLLWACFGVIGSGGHKTRHCSTKFHRQTSKLNFFHATHTETLLRERKNPLKCEPKTQCRNLSK